MHCDDSESNVTINIWYQLYFSSAQKYICYKDYIAWILLEWGAMLDELANAIEQLAVFVQISDCSANGTTVCKW